MKRKFDMLDTADSEAALILMDMSVTIEELSQSSNEEEKKCLVTKLDILEEDVRSLVRKVARKGRIYRELRED